MAIKINNKVPPRGESESMKSYLSKTLVFFLKNIYVDIWATKLNGFPNLEAGIEEPSLRLFGDIQQEESPFLHFAWKLKSHLHHHPTPRPFFRNEIFFKKKINLFVLYVPVILHVKYHSVEIIFEKIKLFNLISLIL